MTRREKKTAQPGGRQSKASVLTAKAPRFKSSPGQTPEKPRPSKKTSGIQ
jgi:hypothetical protein